jgi:hypothetical protein
MFRGELAQVLQVQVLHSGDPGNFNIIVVYDKIFKFFAKIDLNTLFLRIWRKIDAR